MKRDALVVGEEYVVQTSRSLFDTWGLRRVRLLEAGVMTGSRYSGTKKANGARVVYLDTKTGEDRFVRESVKVPNPDYDPDIEQPTDFNERRSFRNTKTGTYPWNETMKVDVDTDTVLTGIEEHRYLRMTWSDYQEALAEREAKAAVKKAEVDRKADKLRAMAETANEMMGHPVLGVGVTQYTANLRYIVSAEALLEELLA